MKKKTNYGITVNKNKAIVPHPSIPPYIHNISKMFHRNKKRKTWVEILNPKLTGFNLFIRKVICFFLGHSKHTNWNTFESHCTVCHKKLKVYD
jgi:hypothetical protein